MAKQKHDALEPTELVDGWNPKDRPPEPTSAVADNPKTGTDPQDPPSADPGLGPLVGERAEPEVAPPDLPQGGEGVSDMNGPSALRDSPWGEPDQHEGSDPRPEGSGFGNEDNPEFHEDLEQLTKKDLQAALREAGDPISGTKEELIERIEADESIDIVEPVEEDA